MPFCTQCSTELDESWNACPNCGNIRPDRTEPGSVSSPSVRNSSTEPLGSLFGDSRQSTEPLGSLFGDSKQSTETVKKSSQKCLNCGSKINTTKTGPMGRAIEWFLGLFFRQTEAEKAESAANKIAPPRCRCGLPIFSDPNNLKETNDLFWIAKESFEPNHWSDIESRGLFPEKIEKYAFRIVNDVQRLDTTVQFKLIRRKLFVQQDGRNVVSEGHDRVARIALNNEHGAQHEYWISVSLTRIRVETKKPNGLTEIRWWTVPTR